ncbi:MAG TPA: hypothetical protein VGK58_00920, partial [Lacipirellulaceae bacterium]
EIIQASPVPEEATMPDREPGLEETLPSPGDTQELELPTSDTTSSMWHETNERQAPYATAEAAADALVGRAGVRFQVSGVSFVCGGSTDS